MTFETFRKSAQGTDPAAPAGLSGALQALWFDARGNWGQAHECAQNDPTKDGSWVHAYLHRKEGDAGNGAYWYSRAGRPEASGSAAAEWEAIARELL